MPRKTTVRGKLVPAGVDIIDHTGEMLAGITNRDAVDLSLWLAARFGKLLKRAYLDEGNWPPRRKR